MSRSLDDFSLMFGKMTAHLDESNEQRKRLFVLVGEVKDEMSKVKIELTALRTEFRTHVDDEIGMAMRVRDAEAKVESVEDKLQAAGIHDPETAEAVKGVAKAWAMVGDTLNAAFRKVLLGMFVVAIMAALAAMGIKWQGGQ